MVTNWNYRWSWQRFIDFICLPTFLFFSFYNFPVWMHQKRVFFMIFLSYTWLFSSFLSFLSIALVCGLFTPSDPFKRFLIFIPIYYPLKDISQYAFNASSPLLKFTLSINTALLCVESLKHFFPRGFDLPQVPSFSFTSFTR